MKKKAGRERLRTVGEGNESRSRQMRGKSMKKHHWKDNKEVDKKGNEKKGKRGNKEN